MPGFNGTGPRGMGPMTGGGRGFCNPYNSFYGAMPRYGAGFASPVWGGRGGGFGRGMGGGRGMGRGMGYPYAYGPRLPYTPYGVGAPYAPYPYPAMPYGPYPYNW
jgi:hypothetical protein